MGCILGARLHCLFPVAYSEIWYSGSGCVWSNIAIAASRVRIALMALGDLENFFCSCLMFSSIWFETSSRWVYRASLLALMMARLSGCKSEVSGRGEVCPIGGGVGLVEVAIVEIWMRVGSCDEDARDKKSNGCE